MLLHGYDISFLETDEQECDVVTLIPDLIEKAEDALPIAAILRMGGNRGNHEDFLHETVAPACSSVSSRVHGTSI
jgi:hypothetical protein